MEEVSFTCRHCGVRSFNTNDWLRSYCGKCHHFCNDVDAAMRMKILNIMVCPRCGILAEEVIRGFGRATLYKPCGHESLLIILKAKSVKD